MTVRALKLKRVANINESLTALIENILENLGVEISLS
jgi:hypothetical protein